MSKPMGTQARLLASRGQFGDGTAAAPWRECAHLGAKLLALEVVMLGLDTRRDWFTCAMGMGFKGIICKCFGCGPGCPGYVVPRPVRSGDD